MLFFSFVTHIMKKDNYQKTTQQNQKVKLEIEMCDARAAGCLGPGWTGFSVNCQIIVSTY